MKPSEKLPAGGGRGCLWLGLLSGVLAWAAAAGPVINPIGNVTVPAGKSVIIPLTATVTNGRALTYSVSGSTNAMALVLHTNNPFWKLNVAQACASNAPGAFQTPYRGGSATVTNVGDMTFMLFPEYAPQTVAIFQGLTDAGFYNSNTIFHRVIAGFMIQGGDPETNGLGGLVFQYNDEFNPQAIFSGSGQLALANSGKNTDGSQFFVTVGPERYLDFQYTLFGQLLRGFNVLSNINNTAVDTNNRPLADEIITAAGWVPDPWDAVLTLTATNRAGSTNHVTVVVDDGVGGRTTNTFLAISAKDTNSNSQPFIYGNTVTNLVGPVNTILTNNIISVNLDGRTNYWFPLPSDANSETNATLTSSLSNYDFNTLTYNETNKGGELHFTVKPTNNYAGPISIYFVGSTNASWYTYYEYYEFYDYLPPYDLKFVTFVFGDTPIAGQAAGIAPQPPGAFANLPLAMFTNGVPNSAVSNFTASIQWGDDSTNAGTITANGSWKQVAGSHAYTNSGVYPITVTIQSALGVTAVVSNAITVQPSLGLTLAGTNSVLAWPSWAFDYGVQSSTNLSGANWLTSTNAGALVGFQNVISNTGGGTPLFFRLKN